MLKKRSLKADKVADEVTETTPVVSSEPPILSSEDRQVVSALLSAVRPSISSLSKHKDK